MLLCNSWCQGQSSKYRLVCKVSHTFVRVMREMHCPDMRAKLLGGHWGFYLRRHENTLSPCPVNAPVRCWSSVGNRHMGKQELSIGENCDRIATVQHEFLHALGFWHEQSRSDRDDYVSIMWDRILSGTFLLLSYFCCCCCC